MARTILKVLLVICAALLAAELIFLGVMLFGPQEPAETTVPTTVTTAPETTAGTEEPTTVPTTEAETVPETTQAETEPPVETEDTAPAPTEPDQPEKKGGSKTGLMIIAAVAVFLVGGGVIFGGSKRGRYSR